MCSTEAARRLALPKPPILGISEWLGIINEEVLVEQCTIIFSQRRVLTFYQMSLLLVL